MEGMVSCVGCIEGVWGGVDWTSGCVMRAGIKTAVNGGREGCGFPISSRVFVLL